MKKIILFVFIMAAMVAFALPALAGIHATTSTSTPGWFWKNKVATTTDWACVRTAVAKRETAVYNAYGTKAEAIKVALNNKKTALNSAYSLTDQKERVKARIKAWNDYKTAVKNATKVYREAVNAAWKQYKTERLTCNLRVENEPVGLELSL